MLESEIDEHGGCLL